MTQKKKRQPFWPPVRDRLRQLSTHWFARSVLTTTLSIVLAFAADRLYEERRDRRQLAEALQRLYQEHRENMAEIDTAMRYQEALIDTLLHQGRDSARTLMIIASEPPYVSYPSLKTTSLSRFLSNDALKYDFDLLSLLSSLDVKHEELRDHFRQIDGVLYAPATNDRGRSGYLQKKLMFNMIGSAMARERDLEAGYRELGEYLEKRGIIAKRHEDQQPPGK